MRLNLYNDLHIRSRSQVETTWIKHPLNHWAFKEENLFWQIQTSVVWFYFNLGHYLLSTTIKFGWPWSGSRSALSGMSKIRQNSNKLSSLHIFSRHNWRVSVFKPNHFGWPSLKVKGKSVWYKYSRAVSNVVQLQNTESKRLQTSHFTFFF